MQKQMKVFCTTELQEQLKAVRTMGMQTNDVLHHRNANTMKSVCTTEIQKEKRRFAPPK
jgi:hypothetical protein